MRSLEQSASLSPGKRGRGVAAMRIHPICRKMAN